MAADLTEVVSMTDSFFVEASTTSENQVPTQKLKDIKMQLKRNPVLNSKISYLYYENLLENFLSVFGMCCIFLL